MTGFWLTVRVLRSFHARASHRLTNAFLLPAGGLRTLPAGDALTTVYRLDEVRWRPNLRKHRAAHQQPCLLETGILAEMPG